jgi:hypothetical protein
MDAALLVEQGCADLELRIWRMRKFANLPG